MHMSDALLSPAVSAVFWAGTLGTIAYCSKKIKDDPEEKGVPLMGVLGAFIFAAQMINFTIPGTGSSGHIGGGMILSIVLGPCPAFIVMASVLTIQALFFADGGLLALGCNIWNLGIYTSFVAYPLIYKPIAGNTRSSRRIMFGSLLAAVVALQLGAFSVSIQTFLSGRSELPLGPFLLFMQPIHLAIGIVEGIVTAAVIGFLKSARPDLLDVPCGETQARRRMAARKVVLSFFLAAVIVAGLLSWFASANPDGLEWSSGGCTDDPGCPARKEKVRRDSSIGAAEDGSAKRAGRVEPGRGHGGRLRKGLVAGRRLAVTRASLSRILGTLMMIVLISLVGFGAKIVKRRGNRPGQRPFSRPAG